MLVRTGGRGRIFEIRPRPFLVAVHDRETLTDVLHLDAVLERY